MVNRRDFLLKGALLSSSGLFSLSRAQIDTLSGATKLIAKNKNHVSYSPLINLSSFSGTQEISGDTPDEAHEIFWDKYGFIKKKGGLPKASESYDVVIVGGGLSGIASAYHLQDKNVLMLEGNPRLGGNARVEKYKDTYMSLGSAYVTVPEKNGLIENYFKDIGVHKHFKRVPPGRSPVLLNGKIIDSFWLGNTDKSNRDEFQRVYKRLKYIYENQYPELPLIPGMEIDRASLNRLDNMTLSQWIRKEFSSIHPHIEEYFHQYCWSSFSTGYDEISAAQFLNFFTADMAGIQALPGGNGMIAVNTLKKLKNSRLNINSNSFVVDIRESSDGVYICYHSDNKKLRAIKAKKCIVTAPKLVAKHIITGLKTSQKSAMDDMSYHAYLVVNVLFKNHLEASHYDLYSLINNIPRSEYEGSKERVFSDITFAHWANKEKAQNSAVTLYLPLPYDMAQQYLFSPALYSKYETRVKNALEPFLKNARKSWDDVKGIRITRYGHAVAVAKSGEIASGKLEKAHAQINDKIFFANQDNWANPCFETSYATGTLAAFQATNRDIPL